MKRESFSTFTTPHEVLKKVYGYQEFRPGQLAIINHVLANKDTLAILPTGGGKSLCFQIPGILKPGITIVVSPLVSLIKDQVDRLNSTGIPACSITSLQTQSELTNTYLLVSLGKFKFVYIAPERLGTKRFQNSLLKQQIGLVVIDEAHCISIWGSDFRPAYNLISQNLKKIAVNAPIIAVTATATPKVQQDICESLELKDPYVFFDSFQRTNLFIESKQVATQTIKNIVLLRLLTKHKNETGIIYCSTRKATQQLSIFLERFGINNQFYHAGLTKKEKESVQLAFLSGYSNLIIATNAFGMGIDKSNIRFVIHYQIPGSIENYYQEIGRAGRDGIHSRCYLLVTQQDIKIQYRMLKKHPNKLDELKSLVTCITAQKCKSVSILEYFGESSPECNNCDYCSLQNKTLKNNQFQLMYHISDTEKEIIQKLLKLKSDMAYIHKQFPLTNTIIAFIAVSQIQSSEELLRVPGVGKGFLSVWWEHLMPVLAA